MRSDFINKRDFQRKRNATSTQNFVDGEIIVIPEFDTFMFYTPAFNPGNDRWDNITNSQNPYQSTELIVGLLNPWNDAKDQPQQGPPFFVQISPRTPTRTVLGFNMSSLPSNSFIISAKLNMTTVRHNQWNTPPSNNRSGLNDYQSMILNEFGSNFIETQIEYLLNTIGD